jgi:hypothetical protein
MSRFPLVIPGVRDDTIIPMEIHQHDSLTNVLTIDTSLALPETCRITTCEPVRGAMITQKEVSNTDSDTGPHAIPSSKEMVEKLSLGNCLE